MRACWGKPAVFFWTVCGCWLLMTTVAFAHPVDNASLTLTEKSPGRFDVDLKVGSKILLRDIQAPARFPSACRWDGTQLDCGTKGLNGELRFDWLEGTLTRLIVDVQWLDGSRLLRMVSASSPVVRVYGRASSPLATIAPVVVDYGALGVHHILAGWDHLCFVIAITMLVKGRRRLIATITAFTVAHSITLAVTSLSSWTIPVAPVEALIALSIVLLCAECLETRGTLIQRVPWLVAFAFGLLHGFGFASALAEVGLPERQLVLALLCFNGGVEVGQLLVVSLCLVLGQVVKRLHQAQRMRTLAVYAMGSVGAAWSIERIVELFSQ